ncbi:MAG: hypothetical protein HQM01_12700 [Magnetococcales bacterium]|nr:hypothetical protein [Magnetococcales bacterium]
MNDIEKIVLGAFSGIVVYVTGQLLSKFFIEPIYELRKSLGEIRFALMFHAPIIHTPIARNNDNSTSAYDALIKCSCDLMCKLYAVPLYGLTRLLACGSLPARKNLEAAIIQLRGLSTHIHEKDNRANESIDVINRRVSKIEDLLGIKPLE